MVNRNIIREFDVAEDEFEQQWSASLGQTDVEDLATLYAEQSPEFSAGQILSGTVLRIEGGEVLVDVGYKSEGLVPLQEWIEEEQEPQPGEEIEVLLEEVEDESGLVRLSKRKAERIRGWERIISEHAEGDVVTGMVTRKIKGGLLVDIGVNVFLPASQVDIRRPHDIGDYIGRAVQAKILKIDETRRNIVVSRRKLIEEQRQEMKKRLLAEIEEGQRRRGVVKNIADFGAFVDLGGIDGLLHITDMSWDRVEHPSQIVSIDQEIEVVVLNVDREKEKIALGLKQKTPSPWEKVEDKYPVGSRVQGEVVNVMSYGAFVKLEQGIEGLVHISEMSWTKRINHPNELVHIGDVIDVVVLGINKEKQEISLGMKQTSPNPWDLVAERYPPGAVVDGTVRNLTNYGAFIEIEEGIDGLLHVSDISWTKKVAHPSEALEKGQKLQCQVLSVDQNRKRIALGLKQMQEDPWENDIPSRYQPGTLERGTVTKLTNFGVFVELEPGLEGLLHISELADHKVESPEEVVSVGQELEVKVLRVDPSERKIGLSLKRAHWGGEEGEGAGEEGPAPQPSVPAKAKPTQELKGGTGDSTGPLFSAPVEASAPKQPEAAPQSNPEEPDAGDAQPAEASAEEATEQEQPPS
jgi:small subunit ribosomal protein S1